MANKTVFCVWPVSRAVKTFLHDFHIKSSFCLWIFPNIHRPAIFSQPFIFGAFFIIH